MEVRDHHTLYLMGRGTSAADLEALVESWVFDPAVVAAIGGKTDYHLALGTNREGEFLGFAYMYCMSCELYFVLCGFQPSGLAGVLVPDPDARAVRYAPKPPVWGKRLPRFDWATETDKEFPLKVLAPCPPVLDLSASPVIVQGAYVPSKDVVQYLRVRNVPDIITAKDLWLFAKPYSRDSSFPVVDLCREKQEAVIAFAPDCVGASFAAFMLRKVEYDPGHFLLFKAEAERPAYRDFERFSG
jgi:hypothetical protein